MGDHSYRLLIFVVVLFVHACRLLTAGSTPDAVVIIGSSNGTQVIPPRVTYNVRYGQRRTPSASQWSCDYCNQHRATPPTPHPSPSLPPVPHPPPPPPPPRDPQPSDFKDIRLYRAYFVLQKFKTTVTCDAQGVISTWSGFDICNTSSTSYQGIFCDTPPDDKTATALAAVDFNGFGICSSALSGFLDGLPDLAFFHANSNNFTGPVPDLTKLPYLYELDLSNNRFSGPFPTDVLSIPQIAFLDLRFNFFSGTVPTAAFSRTGIDVLFLNNNGFSSPLPNNLGFTTAKYLTLANNGFTGPIPKSIANASSTLTEVLFLGNKLSGCLPYEIGFLNGATVFDAGDNLLTGPMPYSFACLSKIEQLNLANNFMYGDLPEIVCSELAMANLQNLSLSNNYFTRVGPACKALVDNGKIDLRMNCIPGLKDQRPHEDCVGFRQSATHCPLPSTYYLVPCKKQVPHDDYYTADQAPLSGSLPDAFSYRPSGGGFNAFSYRRPPAVVAGSGAFSAFGGANNRPDPTPGRRAQERPSASSPTYSALRRQNHRPAGFLPPRVRI